jgi:hypothetical protein
VYDGCGCAAADPLAELIGLGAALVVNCTAEKEPPERRFCPVGRLRRHQSAGGSGNLTVALISNHQRVADAVGDV